MNVENTSKNKNVVKYVVKVMKAKRISRNVVVVVVVVGIPQENQNTILP